MKGAATTTTKSNKTKATVTRTFKKSSTGKPPR